MVERIAEIELSPLDQIRQTEAEVTRRIAAARENAETALENARRQAAELKRQARAAGEREGQARCKELVAKAEEEGRILVAEAYHRTDLVRRQGGGRLPAGVEFVVRAILGEEEGPGS